MVTLGPGFWTACRDRSGVGAEASGRRRGPFSGRATNMTPEDDRRNVWQHGRLSILRFVRMKRMSWLVSVAAACSSSVAWSQETFAALLAKDSLSFSLPKGFAALAAVADRPRGRVPRAEVQIVGRVPIAARFGARTSA